MNHMQIFTVSTIMYEPNETVSIVLVTFVLFSHSMHPVPPDVYPVGNQSMIAFRGRQTVLNFTITRASPDVMPEDTEWIFESECFGQRDAITVSESEHYHFSQDRRSLTILNLTTNDAGNYTLRATNPAGVNSSVILVEMEGEVDT